MINIKKGSLIDSKLLSSMHKYAFTGLQKPWSTDTIYNTILSKSNHALIAYGKNNNPLGFIIYSIIPNIESEILTICVIKTRSGIATKLLKKAMAHGQSMNIENIILDVAIDNNKAISLYRKLGFQDLAIRKDYYKRDNILIDAKLMGLQLK